MDTTDNQEVEDVLDDVDPLSTPSPSRERWASTSQSTSLPDFFGKQTIRCICTHQVHLVTADPNRRCWHLGGIKLHTVGCVPNLQWHRNDHSPTYVHTDHCSWKCPLCCKHANSHNVCLGWRARKTCICLTLEDRWRCVARGTWN